MFKKYVKLLRIDSIKPGGWLLNDMREDLVNGYIGHLDELESDLFNDDIYGNDKLGLKTEDKNVGNIAQHMDDSGQSKWWNSETQSNWLDGFIRHAFMVKDEVMINKANKIVSVLLKKQESSGYFGIYTEDSRYKQISEHGELWSLATLTRALLAYYQFTDNETVLTSVIRAIDHTMANYPSEGNSKPFQALKEICGVSHGLNIVDTIFALYEITGNLKYYNYCLYLYEEFCASNVSNDDAMIKNLIDKKIRLKGHGVHTYEHIRVVGLAAMIDSKYIPAIESYLKKADSCYTPSGGPIGDEWIYEKYANADNTGYEYCSIHEMTDSYETLYRYTLDTKYADFVEWTFYNAAQGSKSCELHATTYLNTDNAYQLDGTRPGEDEYQVRYRYAATHKEAAVCCIPNAGRIIPYFIQNMWHVSNDILIKSLYGPSEFRYNLDGVDIKIMEETEYPYENIIRFYVDVSNKKNITIKFRVPNNCDSMNISIDGEIVSSKIENNFLILQRTWSKKTMVVITFNYQVKAVKYLENQVYFTYGPLLFALPIEAEQKITKEFDVSGFYNYSHLPKNNFTPYQVNKSILNISNLDARLKNKNTRDVTLYIDLIDTSTNSSIELKLIPFADTILRQTTFVLKE